MVRRVLPETRATELQYFQVLLDTNGDGKITFSELMSTIKECYAFTAKMEQPQTLDVCEELKKLATAILGSVVGFVDNEQVEGQALWCTIWCSNPYSKCAQQTVCAA